MNFIPVTLSGLFALLDATLPASISRTHNVAALISSESIETHLDLTEVSVRAKRKMLWCCALCYFWLLKGLSTPSAEIGALMWLTDTCTEHTRCIALSMHVLKGVFCPTHSPSHPTLLGAAGAVN